MNRIWTIVVTAMLLVRPPVEAGELRPIHAPSGGFESVATMEGRFILGNPAAGARNEGAVHVVSAETGEILRTIVSPQPKPNAFCGLEVAIVGGDVLFTCPSSLSEEATCLGNAYLVDPDDGRVVRTFSPASEDCVGVTAPRRFFYGALASSGDSFAVGVSGVPATDVEVYDAASGRLVRRLAGSATYGYFGNGLAFVGERLFVGENSFFAPGTVHMFDGAGMNPVGSFHAPTPSEEDNFAVAVHAAGGDVFVSAFQGSAEGADAIFRYGRSGSFIREYRVPSGFLSYGRPGIVIAGENLLATGYVATGPSSSVQRVAAWNLASGRYLGEMRLPNGHAYGLASDGAKVLVTAGEEAYLVSPRCGDGIVDASESCDDGNTLGGDCCSATCTVAPIGTLCRPSRGDCDPAEACTGTSGECPVDGVAAADVVCRDARGPCDRNEVCDGVGPECPLDAVEPFGTTCESGNACTGSDVCRDGDCVDGPQCGGIFVADALLRGSRALFISVELADPSLGSGSVDVLGYAVAGDGADAAPATRRLRKKLTRANRFRTRVKLGLTRTARRRLAQSGELVVDVSVTVTDGSGTATRYVVQRTWRAGGRK